MAHLEIFGDSITYGVGDPQAGGWAARLRNTMTARLEDYETTTGHDLIYRSKERGLLTYNNAENGMILPTIVQLLPAIFERRARQGYRGRLLVAAMIGFSEHVVPKARFHPVVRLDEFIKSLDAFTTALQEPRYDVERLFVGLPPFDFNRPHPLNVGNFNLRRLDTYQKAIEDHATKTGGHYIDVANCLQAMGESVIGRDGIHPSVVGHVAIHDIVLARIDEIIGERTTLK